MYILSHIYLVFNYVFILVWVRYLFYMLGYSPVLLYFVAQIIASLTIPRSFQFSSITQSCLTLSDSTDCGSPVFPVRHQLPEPTHTHVHWAGDAIQAPLVGFIVLLRIHIIVFLSFFFLKALSHFLKLQYAPGSFCVFSAPILELVFPPRNPNFFCWRMGIINHNLGARCNCYLDVIASRIFQLTEQGNICVYTGLCVYIYL